MTIKKKKKYNARQQLIQGMFLVVVTLVIVSAIFSAHSNLEELGVSSGFNFLDRVTGWGYSFSLLESSINDPYRWTLFSGFINTLFLGTITIIFSTLLGFLVGTARDSNNLAIQSTATIYIQIFRNIPLILQLVFWYAILIHMPNSRQAINLFDLVFISNRGVMIPSFDISWFFIITVFLLLTAYWFFKPRGAALKAVKSSWVYGAVILSTIIYCVFAVEGNLMSVPVLKGLRFVGGTNIPVELITMIVATVLYGAAYIAEVVRGGLQEVPKGLVEAGRALGLSERTIWLDIKMPMALRTIIPPLGNQWVFMMKATTVGVAIGFSDLFMLVSTSITQSGQTLELIGILMAAFLLINFSLAQFVNYLNKRLSLQGH